MRMKCRLLSFGAALCMVIILFSSLACPAEAVTVSDWVLESSVPSGAEITARKWVYTKTSYADSYDTSLSGYSLLSSEWTPSGSGSMNYASFPSGFDTGHSIYTSFAKSSVCPYSSSETETAKRTVSDSWGGYVYWHWMYNVSYANRTDRAISGQRLTSGTNGFAYIYFYAFTSRVDCPYLDKYYCNNQTLPAITAPVSCRRQALSASARPGFCVLSTAPLLMPTTGSCFTITKPSSWNLPRRSVHPAPLTRPSIMFVLMCSIKTALRSVFMPTGGSTLPPP